MKVKIGAKSHIKPLQMNPLADPSTATYLKLETLIGKPESTNISGPFAVKIVQINDQITTKANKMMR